MKLSSASPILLPSLSLAVVGADYPNKRGPGRRFEIELCKAGESVELRAEPKNPADPRAIAIYSCRGVQIGFLTAERAPLIGKSLADGVEVRAVFQRKTTYGAAIRVAFDGEEPTLPPDIGRTATLDQSEPDFWPDPISPDEE